MTIINNDVLNAITAERAHQTKKWGDDKQQSLPGFLLILRKELEEAEQAWMKNHTEPRQSVLEEVTQVAAVAIACLEKYGTKGSAISTDDMSNEELKNGATCYASQN